MAVLTSTLCLFCLFCVPSGYNDMPRGNMGCRHGVQTWGTNMSPDLPSHLLESHDMRWLFGKKSNQGLPQASILYSDKKIVTDLDLKIEISFFDYFSSRCYTILKGILHETCGNQQWLIILIIIIIELCRIIIYKNCFKIITRRKLFGLKKSP